jgi:tetratricopeptide (TPR) repeat protein
MLKTSLLTVVALILVTAVAPLARAQDDRASDNDARAQFDVGRAAYDEGRFEDAAGAFRRAYVLSPRYQLLYNIGQAELRGGHDDRALGAFEGFLRQAPEDDPRRSEVQERAKVLRDMGVTPAEAVTDEQTGESPTDEASRESTEVSKAPPAAKPSSKKRVGPWVMLGSGAAGIVAGAVLMGLGVSKAHEVTDATVGAHWSQLKDTGDKANMLWGVGLAATAVGLAAVGGGVAWALMGSSDEEPSADTTLSLRVGPASLALEGAF